jgi:release factor glutamine methyltransferase
MDPNGLILLEHGHDQGAAVAQLLRLAACRSVETLADLSGNQRVTAARAP